MKNLLVIVLVTFGLSNIAMAQSKIQEEVFRTMSAMMTEMGGNGYAGIQEDGTAMSCGVGKDLSLTRTQAGNRARAILAFAAGNAKVRQRIEKLPNGKKMITTFKTVVATGISIPEQKLAKLSNGRWVICARAQALVMPK